MTITKIFKDTPYMVLIYYLLTRLPTTIHFIQLKRLEPKGSLFGNNGAFVKMKSIKLSYLPLKLMRWLEGSGNIRTDKSTVLILFLSNRLLQLYLCK